MAHTRHGPQECGRSCRFSCRSHAQCYFRTRAWEIHMGLLERKELVTTTLQQTWRRLMNNCIGPSWIDSDGWACIWRLSNTPETL